jgi:hypothetical protein
LFTYSAALELVLVDWFDFSAYFILCAKHGLNS